MLGVTPAVVRGFLSRSRRDATELDDTVYLRGESDSIHIITGTAMRHVSMGMIMSLLILPFTMGCGGAESGPGTAPNQDELTQFLQENPDIANETYEEVSEDPDAG